MLDFTKVDLSFEKYNGCWLISGGRWRAPIFNCPGLKATFLMFNQRGWLFYLLKRICPLVENFSNSI